MNDENSWDELRERLRRFVADTEPGDLRRMHDDAVPLERERMMALVEQVLTGHPEESQLRTILDLGGFPVFKVSDERIEVYLGHVDGRSRRAAGVADVAGERGDRASYLARRSATYYPANGVDDPLHNSAHEQEGTPNRAKRRRDDLPDPARGPPHESNPDA